MELPFDRGRSQTWKVSFQGWWVGFSWPESDRPPQEHLPRGAGLALSCAWFGSRAPAVRLRARRGSERPPRPADWPARGGLRRAALGLARARDPPLFPTALCVPSIPGGGCQPRA